MFALSVGFTTNISGGIGGGGRDNSYGSSCGGGDPDKVVARFSRPRISRSSVSFIVRRARISWALAATALSCDGVWTFDARQQAGRYISHADVYIFVTLFCVSMTHVPNNTININIYAGCTRTGSFRAYSSSIVLIERSTTIVSPITCFRTPFEFEGLRCHVHFLHSCRGWRDGLFSRPVQASTELLLPSNATYPIVLVIIKSEKRSGYRDQRLNPPPLDARFAVLAAEYYMIRRPGKNSQERQVVRLEPHGTY